MLEHVYFEIRFTCEQMLKMECLNETHRTIKRTSEWEWTHCKKKSRRQQQQQQQPLMRIKCGKKRHECLWHLLTFCAANLQLWWQFLLLFALLPIEIAQVHSQLWANRKIIEKKNSCGIFFVVVAFTLLLWNSFSFD